MGAWSTYCKHLYRPSIIFLQSVEAAVEGTEMNGRRATRVAVGPGVWRSRARNRETSSHTSRKLDLLMMNIGTRIR